LADQPEAGDAITDGHGPDCGWRPS
jgi:hypothetical protein